MTISRQDAEVVLIARVGKMLTAADLDGTTKNGGNEDLSDPIAVAVRMCGGSVASLRVVTDDDLAGVATDDIDKFFDVAEARVLENVLGNLDDVDLSVGPRKESFSQLAEQTEKKLTRLQKKLEKEYGIGLMALESGVVNLNFATHGDDTEY